MKKFLLTAFYLMALFGFCSTLIQVFPIIWPIQPMNFIVLAAALLVCAFGTIEDILDLYIEESQ